MEMDLNVLEKTIITIFGEIKKRGINCISLEADFYWTVPSESICDIYNEPNQLDVGQLEDDYEILRLAHETDQLMGYNLKNVSAIMRYLSEKYPF